MDTPYLVYFRTHPLNDLGQQPGIAGSGIEANVAADEFLRNRLCRLHPCWSEWLVVHSAIQVDRIEPHDPHRRTYLRGETSDRPRGSDTDTMTVGTEYPSKPFD